MNQHNQTIQGPVSAREVVTVEISGTTERRDLLAVEAPLEIRLGFGAKNGRQQKRISVTMRTPGQDLELALGFLYSEGIIAKPTDVLSVRHCTDLGKAASRENVVRVELAEDCDFRMEHLDRNFFTNSSCGVCGKSSIEAVQHLHHGKRIMKAVKLESTRIHPLQGQVRSAQQIFSHTGGLHAAALFDLQGKLLCMREDVGRHNALDKLIGASVFGDKKLAIPERILFLSGRISFELVQKALAAQISLIVAVGAPSSLAVELAEEVGICLVGFARENRFNIYTYSDRIQL